MKNVRVTIEIDGKQFHLDNFRIHQAKTIDRLLDDVLAQLSECGQCGYAWEKCECDGPSASDEELALSHGDQHKIDNYQSYAEFLRERDEDDKE